MCIPDNAGCQNLPFFGAVCIQVLIPLLHLDRPSPFVGAFLGPFLIGPIGPRGAHPSNTSSWQYQATLHPNLSNSSHRPTLHFSLLRARFRGPALLFFETYSAMKEI